MGQSLHNPGLENLIGCGVTTEVWVHLTMREPVLAAHGERGTR